MRLQLVLLLIILLNFLISLFQTAPDSVSGNREGKKILFKGPAGLGDRMTALVCYKVIADYAGYDFVVYNNTEESHRTYDLGSMLNNIEMTDNPENFSKFISHKYYIGPPQSFEIIRQFNPDITFEEVAKSYEDTFRLVINTDIADPYITADDTVYGIHLRKGDKIGMVGNLFQRYNEMTSVEVLESIMAKFMDDVRRLVQIPDTKFLVVSENEEWRQEVISEMRKAGNFILVENKPVDKSVKGLDAFVDMISLSRCKQVHMCVGFSAMSFAAAILGDIPLITYVDDKQCFEQYQSCVSINGKPKIYDVDTKCLVSTIESNLK